MIWPPISAFFQHLLFHHFPSNIQHGGVQGGRAVLLEVFLAWSYEYQKNKEAILGTIQHPEKGSWFRECLQGYKLLKCAGTSPWIRVSMQLNERKRENIDLGRMMFYSCKTSGWHQQICQNYGRLVPCGGHVPCWLGKSWRYDLFLGFASWQSIAEHQRTIVSGGFKCPKGLPTVCISPSAWLSIYCTYSEEEST